MSSKRKGLRYSQKPLERLDYKREESATLRMKVLRYVMAVGFVLSPWLGGEAYADAGNITFVKDQNTNLMQNGKAHIYAQDVDSASKVGLNRFQDFKVAPNEIANLYFQDTNGTQVNTLVNTVVNRIDISGTVNGIRNNTIGGNLYFISPRGMVVGAGGVINAGALTVITTGVDKITTPAEAISTINSAYSNSSSLALTEQPIEIHGQINTVNGIDLRSLSIAISQASNSDVKAYLKTGMVFKTIVNTDGLIDKVELTGERSNSTDTKIELCAYKMYWDDHNEENVKSFGNINLSGCELDAIGDILIDAGDSLTINSANLKSKGLIKMDFTRDDYRGFHGDLRFNSGKIEADGLVDIRIGKTITIGDNAEIISKITKDATYSKVTLMTSTGDITNNGTISASTSLDIQAGINRGSDDASIANSGTIKATGGGMSFTMDKSLTNTGIIQAGDQIVFTVGGTLTNEGKIESTSSNVQAHIGRNFKNIAVYNNESTENRTLKGGIIEAGGNVQVDYNLDNEGIGVASSEEHIDGIYNSGLIWAKGENGKDPVYDEAGNITNSGSGNIWLTSAYNITNDGTMKANRQITLNARDFLHNYGLIQGVTYLDIKSIMGYVYNHTTGRIISTGGNIALSSGQANLEIQGDTDGQKKELYRKFTPIIIEGLVEATSDDDKNNQTREGNIKITAYLGDIYINGGTIKTKPELGTNKEVKAEAGDVILDAAQNITIGFDTVKAWDDDPTTDAVNGSERGYYKPKVDDDENLVSGTAAQITGSNITLKSGSNEKYYILISNTTTGSNALPASNTLTASNAITINTNSMNIVGGTFNAGTLEAVLAENGALNITGGTINAASVNSNTDMSINGGVIYTGTAQGRLSANNISMESGSVSGKDVTIAAAEQVQLNGGSITAQAEGAGKLTVTAGTNLVHDGATIAADNATFSAGNKIDLQSGSLTATGAAAFDVTSGTAGANSILESASGYNLSVGSLSLSANQGNIILNGTNNVLQGVTLANVGGNVEIVNGNDTKALTIATANGTTVGGTINVTNNDEAIIVEGINATDNVNLTAGKNITVAGDVDAANASFNAGQDFIQSSGTITASGAVVTAGRDVKLNSGRMEASTNASLTAGSATSVEAGHGYIYEGTEYALITPQVNASAVGAITLDSSANQLVNVNVTKVGAALALGSGNKNSNEALQVDIGQVVSGNLTINNYSLEGDNSANDIVFAGTLSADNITITNAEADINAGTDAVISADSISLQANSGAVNVDGNATITAANTTANNATFVANALDINIAGGQITADTVTITSNGTADNSGFTMNGGTITANTANITATKAINQTAGSIVATATVASAGTDLSLASNANKLQNVTIKANNGSASIVSGNDARVALKVQTYGTVGGCLSIQSTSDILSEGTISAAGDVTMTAGDKVTINSGIINANKLTANAADLSVNGGTINVHTLAASKGLNIANDTQNTAVTNITANSITAGGSIGITGGNVVTTSVAAGEALNITGGSVSSDSLLSLSSVTGVTIGIQAAISTGGDLTLAASNGAVINKHAWNNENGSVTLSGKTGVTNSASITARDSVVMTSEIGDVTTSGTITAGNINLTAGTSKTISWTADSTLTASDTINLTTDNMQISGGTIKANTLASSGSLNIASNPSDSNNTTNITATNITAGGSIGITGGDVTTASVSADGDLNITGGTVSSNGSLEFNGGIVTIGGNTGISTSGDLTIIGSGNVSINNNTNNTENITASGDLTISSINGALTNNRDLSVDGSVSLNGNKGVTNTANITAGQAVSIISLAGAIDNSNAITANTGSVTLQGNDGVTNRMGAGITAGLKVDMISEAGAVSNSSALQANGGSVTLNGKNDVTNAAAITATDSVTIISQDEAIDNSGALTATTGSVSITGNKNITNHEAATISAGQDVGITSDEGTINNTCSLKATTGSVDLTGKMGVINNIANGRITANDSVSMISSDGSINNASALTATTGSVTMSGKTGVGNSVNANITANSGISMIASSGAITNSSVLDGGSGSVVLSGSRGVSNSANITAGQNITLQSIIEVIENIGILSAGQGIGLTSTEGTILNNGMLTARGSSVALKGYKGIINNGYIEAKGNVSIISEDGSIINRAGIVAGKSFATPAASPFSLRARAMARAVDNGSVVISGKDGVINHNDNVNTSIIATGSVSITSEAGSVTNSSDVKAYTGSVTISGNGGVTNTANITANQNVNLSAKAGAISNAGSVTAGTGNIGLNSNNGITSTAEGFNSLNGSIRAATTYGEVNISEIIAGGNATASSQNGSVSIGTVAGNDVVLTGGSDVSIGTVTGSDVALTGGSNVAVGTVTGSDVALTGGSNVTIGSVTGSNVAITGGSYSDVKVDNITVDNSLKLQGDNITATNVNRSENANGALNVDVSGAGSTDSTAQGDVNLKIEGDVVFNNLNVTNAKIETTGTLDSSKMHVEGKAQITSSNTTVNVYGKDVTPDPNDRNAIQDKGGGVSLKIDSNGVKSDGLGVDYPVQLSGKLVDYDPYDTYLEHYGDVADIFGRTDLIIAAESPSGDFAQGGVVILKQDAEGLRIEEQKKEE